MLHGRVYRVLMVWPGASVVVSELTLSVGYGIEKFTLQFPTARMSSQFSPEQAKLLLMSVHSSGES